MSSLQIPQSTMEEAQGPLARWQRVLANIATAAKAKPIMERDPNMDMRDAATVTYVEAVDGLLDDLAAMKAAGQLDHVSSFLAAVDVRV
jgi:hypothetical protein